LGWPLEGTVFFTLRRLVRRMGLDVLVEAFARIAARSADGHLCIGGSGPERSGLENLVRARGLGNRVTFLGRLSDDDIERAYAAATAFVLPTRSLECFGLIALEALTQGCPVLAARVAAIPEMLDPIAPGCLFPPGDAGALADLLEGVRSGSLELPRAEVLKRYACERYGREAIERQYAALIEGGGVM
jgi:glycosyltransferase involved in cell wall biosynthesis